jgi:hypothetical protein
MRRDCSIGVGRRDVLDSGCHLADQAQAEQGREEQNVVLALVVAFMLLELGERFAQRTFPEHDQVGQALLFNRSHPALTSASKAEEENPLGRSRANVIPAGFQKVMGRRDSKPLIAMRHYA